MRRVVALLKKDLTTEFRTGAQFLPFISVSLLLVTFLGLGAKSFITDDRLLGFLFHPLAWSVFLLSGAMVVVRIFEGDREAKTIRALFLFRMSPTSFYGAKLLFIAALLIVNHVISSALLAAILGLHLAQWFGPYLVLTIVVSLVYASLAAFLGGFISGHSQRHILFPLVFLPLLFPVFFAVLEVSISIAIGNGVLGAGNWFSLILGLGLVYFVVSILLFDVVVKD